MNTKRAKPIQYRKYLEKDSHTIHAPLLPELEFYAAIKSGDVRKVEKLCKEDPFHKKQGLGVLSKNALRNLKYHFVISAAMIARVCITGGMQMTESYELSDYYIAVADLADSIDRVSLIHDEMCIAYAERMHDLNHEHIYSKQITKCIDYILEHLDTRIKMDDLCRLTSLSSSYLSRLFRKETGLTVSRYILLKKIETARNMLAYSDYPIMWISNALAFPSQSYFTKVFTEECKITPGKYREMSADMI